MEPNRIKELIARIGSLQLSLQIDEDDQVRLEDFDLPYKLIRGRRVYSLTAESREGKSIPVTVERVEGDHNYVVYVEGEAIDVELETERDKHLKSFRRSTAAGRSAGQTVRAPMPGMLKEILVSEGQSVGRGESLCILEAMKMENEIKATADLVVKRVIAEAGRAVEKGAPLLELEPPEVGEVSTDGSQAGSGSDDTSSGAG